MATYKPGESSGNHGHPDNAIYIISGGESDQTPSGEIKQKVSLVSGASAVHPASSHSVKNTGHTTLKVLIVEVNRPGN